VAFLVNVFPNRHLGLKEVSNKERPTVQRQELMRFPFLSKDRFILSFQKNISGLVIALKEVYTEFVQPLTIHLQTK